MGMLVVVGDVALGRHGKASDKEADLAMPTGKHEDHICPRRSIAAGRDADSDRC